jgi:hypothetical protein
MQNPKCEQFSSEGMMAMGKWSNIVPKKTQKEGEKITFGLVTGLLLSPCAP